MRDLLDRERLAAALDAAHAHAERGRRGLSPAQRERIQGWMPSPLVFHFDFISPYAFLAWTQVRGVAARAGRTLEPVPVLFAALLDAHGTKGPAEIPAKRRYLFKDIAQKAHRLGGEGAPPPLASPQSRARISFHPILRRIAHRLAREATAERGDDTGESNQHVRFIQPARQGFLTGAIRRSRESARRPAAPSRSRRAAPARTT